ncbi:MAG: class I tRNA ligase family protein [Candidatus Taylorbacteria bacterium]|nr:class I tRNA ligase family protein [Candidatus Taylorbacteria bacterium]
MSDTLQQPAEGGTSPEKTEHALREERVLNFWNVQGIFQKSLKKDSPKGEFVFYDGPPFATGTPHYGHILAGTIKDVIPRYKTMQGYHVPRRWGWDCHGLPLENLIEKELNLASKKDIEILGVGKFNEAARNAVLRYAHVWKEQVPRLGRWVDMENDYRTMDASYTESVWWVFQNLYNKGLIYESFKSMHLCPRCGTTLSNFEVNQGYKDITDISVYVKFEILGEKNTYLLAWTTTPWTLPGNVALAVGSDIEYVKIKIGEAVYILAKDRLSVVKENYEIVSELKGSELVGKKYKPVFEYYSNDTKLENRQNGWKVYAAPFVTTTDGTGIVHIAPAYGADDYDLSQKEKTPFIQHVGVDGKFKKEVTDFAGLTAKPKGEKDEKDPHQKSDIEVIKYLAAKNVLFAKEKIVHSYPHCWRCETPLLNYATSSWFVKVTDFKDKLVKANKKVGWTPSLVGENRFGKWLEGARDWAISRSRYWGAPIPVWKSEDGKEVFVPCSVADMRARGKRTTNFFLMRHGETEYNQKGLISPEKDIPDHLTIDGREQVKVSADRLKSHLGSSNIDVIVASPFVRTRETVTIVSEILGVPRSAIIFDDRLGEVHADAFKGRPWKEYLNLFKDRDEAYVKNIDGVENLSHVRARVGEVLYELNTKFAGKNVLIVSHGTPLKNILAVSLGKNTDASIPMFDNAEVRKLDFVPLPHNEKYELDFHRPFIDDVTFLDSRGGVMRRVPDVFDCWFESGSMPYGEAHYMGRPVATFDPKGGLLRSKKGFPADFIAEGLDQTRGWFYSMMVLGVALFGKSPYKHVIVNGLILAEDGRKMSKSLKNFPDPMDVVGKYGMDAVRYYLLSSQAVAGEDLCFSEKGVDDVVKKVINRLNNVVSFYEMYAKNTKNILPHANSKNILDIWIISRLNETIMKVTTGLENYELNTAIRPVYDFIEDLSVWYLRRSRDRFKSDDVEDKQAALITTQYVLIELSKIMAPFMPFLAEDMYSRVKTDSMPESVHLTVWPVATKIHTDVIVRMQEVRKLVTLGLEARTKAKINVRQPLARLMVTPSDITKKILAEDELVALIRDEVNVKDVVVDSGVTEGVTLDLSISDELKEEGTVRELIRAIQDLRKEIGLNVGDTATLSYEATGTIADVISKNAAALMKATQLTKISPVTFPQENSAKTITVADAAVKILISR